MEIIPAILPKDFSEIEEKTELIKSLSKTVQIDICDGKYTKSSTWPYKKKDENFELIIREDRGMPEWEYLDYEFDLMIKDISEDEIRKWISAGAKRIVLHCDSSTNLMPIIDIMNGLIEIGIAINANTNIKCIENYINKIQYIQCMGIDNIGFQGQKFNSNTIDKIKEIRNNYKDIQIQVDGGITLENAPLLKNIGVNRLIIGSALFESENIVETYNKFKRI